MVLKLVPQNYPECRSRSDGGLLSTRGNIEFGALGDPNGVQQLHSVEISDVHHVSDNFHNIEVINKVQVRN